MRQTFTLPSSNQQHNLAVYVWQAKEPKCAVQLIHGMAEFALRYEPLIHYLNQHHITVIAHDHVGHGHSVDSNHPEYGFIADAHPVRVILDDIHNVRQIIKTAFPQLPIFAIGHSMGSFALRLSCVRYPHDYNGVIYLGTGSTPPLLPIGELMASVANYIQPHLPNKWIHNATFAFFPLHYDEPYHPLNWISQSKANRSYYSHHPLLGFTFTSNGFYTLFQLVKKANQSSFFTHYNPDLPTLFVSGKEDPIGQYGKGVVHVAKKLQQAGVKDVHYRLYDDLRHEILNEDHPLPIMQYITDWIHQHL